jgi:phosphatidylglycerol lysyltransferase
LALAPNAQWFPWPWVKWGWVGFDAVLTVSLLSLAAQWRRWLGAALAIAVSADAALTIAEASVFNVPRAQSVLDGTIIAAACAAPTVAAAILWSALARRD